mmetsp:Transcript_2281/g.6355  ORF Transcript_2281/g.6355 Transcript_2281/m.6355 type:complete len:201 (+) Transcript_2281:223-825(+)
MLLQHIEGLLVVHLPRVHPGQVVQGPGLLPFVLTTDRVLELPLKTLLGSFHVMLDNVGPPHNIQSRGDIADMAVSLGTCVGREDVLHGEVRPLRVLVDERECSLRLPFHLPVFGPHVRGQLHPHGRVHVGNVGVSAGRVAQRQTRHNVKEDALTQVLGRNGIFAPVPVLRGLIGPILVLLERGTFGALLGRRWFHEVAPP